MFRHPFFCALASHNTCCTASQCPSRHKLEYEHSTGFLVALCCNILFSHFHPNSTFSSRVKVRPLSASTAIVCCLRLVKFMLGSRLCWSSLRIGLFCCMKVTSATTLVGN